MYEGAKKKKKKLMTDQINGKKVNVYSVAASPGPFSAFQCCTLKRMSNNAQKYMTY